MSKFQSLEFQSRMTMVRQLIRQAKVEEQVQTFLLEPHARLHRSAEDRAPYAVELTVAGQRVAGATSDESYLDALANAMWALQLWREAEQAEALALQSVQP